jgi:hypothetical protein
VVRYVYLYQLSEARLICIPFREFDLLPFSDDFYYDDRFLC